MNQAVAQAVMFDAVARGRVGYLPMTNCWPWLGPMSLEGYPRTYREGGRSFSPRRIAYVELHGKLSGQLHNRCGDTKCINPDHQKGNG